MCIRDSVNTETKQLYMQWKHKSSPKPKKFKQTFAGKKIMAPIFWDHQGVLLVEFLECHMTINSPMYCQHKQKNELMKESSVQPVVFRHYSAS